MKNFILRISTGLVCMAAALPIWAEVTGKILSSDKQPIIGASAVLLTLPDSTYIKGTLTDADGTFTLSSDSDDKPYLLLVQSFGYEKKYVRVPTGLSKPLEIVLENSSTELDEVVVHGRAPIMKREGGKFIFVPNELADEVSSANTLMMHVPLVSWNDSGGYITGRGLSKVYLNGRDTQWDYDEIQSMLRTLDPHLIKRVEIITDPGATQSASFNGGVINIIYDDPHQGWRGNLAANNFLMTNTQFTMPHLWMNYQRGQVQNLNQFSISVF